MPRRPRSRGAGRTGHRPDAWHSTPRRAGGRAGAAPRAALHAARRAPRGGRPGGRRTAEGRGAALRGGGPGARRPRQRAPAPRGRTPRRREEAVDLATSPWRLQPTSATFHGRDVFAPIAGRLAAGAPLAEAGAALDPSSLVRLELPRPRRDGATLVAHAVAFDHFGNALLDAGESDLAREPGAAVSVLGRPAVVRHHVRRRAQRRAADLRGLLRRSRPRGEPGLGARRAAPAARRRRPHRLSVLGTPRLHLREIGSTSDRARDLAAAGAPHGTLVTTDHQVAGRGRQGRAWTTPPRSALTMSLVLRDFTPLLPLAAGVAVAEAIGPAAAIKWPNDVLWTGARSRGSSPRAGLPTAGRCWASASTSRCARTTSRPSCAPAPGTLGRRDGGRRGRPRRRS